VHELFLICQLVSSSKAYSCKAPSISKASSIIAWFLLGLCFTTLMLLSYIYLLYTCKGPKN